MEKFHFPWYLRSEKRTDANAPTHWYDVDLRDSPDDLILQKLAMVIVRVAGSVTFQGVGDEEDQTQTYAVGDYISPNGAYPGGWIKKIANSSVAKNFRVVVYKGK